MHRTYMIAKPRTIVQTNTSGALRNRHSTAANVADLAKFSHRQPWPFSPQPYLILAPSTMTIFTLALPIT